MSAPLARVRRVGIMAEMHGRDLTRRHVALALLVALPLSFYLSSAGTGDHPQAVAAGGTSLAFAVGGATLFSALSSIDVDQRLVLGGYRPLELLLGRLLFLGPLGLAIAAGFAAVMDLISHPEDPWLVVLGVGVVALVSVPFGLAVGAIVPRELEGTLVLIGVVGIQLAVAPDSAVAAALPFHGPRQVIEAGVSGSGALLGPLLLSLAWGVGLLAVARLFVGPRLTVHRPGPPTL